MSEAPPVTEVPSPVATPEFAAADSPKLAIEPSSAPWHGDTQRTSPVRIFLITVLLLCTTAGLIVGLAALPRKPTDTLFVSVSFGEYGDPVWPVNPWAERDADALAARFGGSGVKAFAFQEGQHFRSLLGWLGGERVAGLPTRDSRRSLVVHLSAIAAVRGQTVYLIPADAPPDDPTKWVDVSDILQATARGGPHTLLLLDIARPFADPFGGTLGDDVSAILYDILSAAPPTFPVFVACGPGEVSLSADSAGQSAFAFYLAEGLGGAADGFDDPDGPDGVVTVRELARFTAARVDRWARLTHGRRQTPTLYASDSRTSDFVVVRKSPWKPDTTPAVAYPNWLRDASAQRDAIRVSEPARRDPVAFARLTAGFLAAEQRWLRPGNAVRAEDVWQAARDEWSRAAARVPAVSDWSKLPAAADHLAVSRIGKPDAPPELTKLLTAYLLAKPEQEAEAATAWATAARPHRTAAVGLVWTLAADTAAPTAEMVDRWAKAVTSVDPVKPLAETRVLQDIAARESFRRQKLASYPSAAVTALFRAEESLGRLVALGPAEFTNGAETATAATREYKAGVTRLRTANTAADVAEATAALTRATDGFRLAADRIQQARAGRSAFDLAALVLGETLTGMTEFDRPASSVWLTVADLAARVADVGPHSVTSAEIAALTSATERLMTPYTPSPVLRVIAPNRRTDPRGVSEMCSLLAGPALGGTGRSSAWDALLADTAKLHAGVRERDEGDDRPAPPVPLIDPTAGRKVRRAEASVRLLRLAGSPAADEADTMLRKAMAAGSADESDRRWEELGTRLRTAWLKELPDLVRKGAPAAARVVRAVPPAAARYRVWADLPAPRPVDSFAAYREWIEGTVMEEPR